MRKSVIEIHNKTELILKEYLEKKKAFRDKYLSINRFKKMRKVPIERLNKFFSQDDFELEIDFGREWLEGGRHLIIRKTV